MPKTTTKGKFKKLDHFEIDDDGERQDYSQVLLVTLYDRRIS